MKLEALEPSFTVCKVKDYSRVNWRGFCFIGQTDQENSLVCQTEYAPDDALAREDGWRGFRVVGELDFSLVGILARLSAALAKEQIGIFAVSTYNTDYIFTKADNFDRALAALKSAGWDTE